MTHFTFNVILTAIALFTIVALSISLYYFTLGGDHE